MAPSLGFPSPSPPDNSKATLKQLSSYNSHLLRRVSSHKLLSISSTLLFRTAILLTLTLVLLFTLHYPSLLSHSLYLSSPHPSSPHRSLLSSNRRQSLNPLEIRRSATPTRTNGLSILVTGAAGFVGTHCSLALKARGDGVLGLDNFNSYYDPSLKRARQKLLHRNGVVIVEADINDAQMLIKLFQLVHFTHVLHLAAQAGVRYAMKSPQSYIQSNIAGLVSLLEVAAKNADPQPAIVWASSSSVYGLNTVSPFSESHRTDRPASLYAATKKAGEEIAHVYNHIYGLSLTGLRFFTVYGPWGRPDMAYFSFVHDIIDGKPINIFTNAKRDFTYIDDVVKGVIGALDSAKRSTGLPGGGKKTGPAELRVYNLGNTSPVPVTKMVSIIESLLGKKAKKNVVEMPSNGDVPYTHANVSLAHRDFGYQPTTDLGAGLKQFVKWYVEYYKLDVITKKKEKAKEKVASS
ncbi:UDP-glucuronate 4-epimerase 6 [Carex littledalei]|uniref:UDP-glucuronate 4-epimerase n=1 Tax=Carex littledalei TaxID=544730 RepID=A0A833QJC4_9POAL|nr:UDP-glucuronate 4-epimerase 6 [Carex littledalei]